MEADAIQAPGAGRGCKLRWWRIGGQRYGVQKVDVVGMGIAQFNI